jgi:hypothetical protein
MPWSAHGTMKSLVPPPILMQRFEQGRLSREELHAAMAEHSQVLIAEMTYEVENRQESWVERWRCRHHASRLANRHGESRMRDVLLALSLLPDFPPCNLLWNAAHTHVPLYCFFRLKRPPIFMIRMMRCINTFVEVEVEYSNDHEERIREKMTLERGRSWDFQISTRKIIEAK